jgi:hypothetical protein
VVSAAIASAPEVNSNSIIAAGVGVIPALGAVIVQAANAVPLEKTPPPSTVSQSGMMLGNIRVQEVQGKGVKLVDSYGKTTDLKEGDFVRQGVQIITGPEGRVVLIFENGSLIQVNPNSEFAIEKFHQDPIGATELDYSKIQNEPSISFTRTGITKGEIMFDVATLNNSSTYEIITPVGVAGIRGTGGFVKSTPKNLSQVVSFGLFEGAAIFTSAAGQAHVVNQNQSIGISGPNRNFDVTLNPFENEISLTQSKQSMNRLRPQTPANPFIGSPPNTPAPASPLSQLTSSEQISLQKSLAEGPQSVAETVLQLAMESPNSAADLAAAASDISPAIATTIAITFSNTFPNYSAAIAASLCYSTPVLSPAIAAVLAFTIQNRASEIASATVAVVPNQATIIATWVSILLPSKAGAIASSVASTIPYQTPSIAAAVAGAVPSQAADIASAVASRMPSQAATVASAVSSTVPLESKSIAAAVSNAVPTQAIAIAAAVQNIIPNRINSINPGDLNKNNQQQGIPSATPSPQSENQKNLLKKPIDPDLPQKPKPSPTKPPQAVSPSE